MDAHRARLAALATSLTCPLEDHHVSGYPAFLVPELEEWCWDNLQHMPRVDFGRRGNYVATFTNASDAVYFTLRWRGTTEDEMRDPPYWAP